MFHTLKTKKRRGKSKSFSWKIALKIKIYGMKTKPFSTLARKRYVGVLRWSERENLFEGKCSNYSKAVSLFVYILYL